MFDSVTSHQFSSLRVVQQLILSALFVDLSFGSMSSLKCHFSTCLCEVECYHISCTQLLFFVLFLNWCTQTITILIFIVISFANLAFMFVVTISLAFEYLCFVKAAASAKMFSVHYFTVWIIKSPEVFALQNTVFLTIVSRMLLYLSHKSSGPESWNILPCFS